MFGLLDDGLIFILFYLARRAFVGGTIRCVITDGLEIIFLLCDARTQYHSISSIVRYLVSYIEERKIKFSLFIHQITGTDKSSDQYITLQTDLHRWT